MKKKIVGFFATLILANYAYADGIFGTIVDVNDASKSIIVETTSGQRMNMKILPNTEIDMDDCGIFGTDKYGTFRDLKVGTFIEAEIFYSQMNPQDAMQNATVRKIDIECKKRAY